MEPFELAVNRERHSIDVAPNTPLLWVLRDELGLTGTKYGCGVALCGACTVLLNGEPVRACVMPVSGVGDAEVTTIEGLASDGGHRLQDAWVKEAVPQCGYCQAGMLMTAAALLRRTAHPSDEEIDAALAGNVCRCGTYLRIRGAVKRAVREG
jgi:isoquinoline 1-oxidoreductase alpha subunit